MGFAFARANRDAYLLLRQEIQETVMRSVPVATSTTDLSRYLSIFEHQESDEIVETLVHQHVENCTCQLRGS